MVHLRKIILTAMLAVVALMPFISRAQADPLLTHYFEVPSFYNPAAIGTTDLLRIRGLGRMQWVGIDHAPQNFMGVADMPVKLLGKKLAVGLTLNTGSEGLYKDLQIAAQVGYKFKLLKGEMTVGVQAGLLDEGFEGSKVFIPDNDDFHQSTDEAIPTTDVHGTTVDLGAGAFYSHKLFWAGISCRHVNSPTVKLQGEGGMPGAGAEGESGTVKNFEFTAPRTLYFMAGSNIAIKNTLFEVMPSIMVASDFTFTTGQVTARLRYNKFLTAGIGYRYNDAVTALLGGEFKGFYIGYSYEYPTSAIAKASSGSHEVVVGYSMKLDFSEKNKHRHKNIRIM